MQYTKREYVELLKKKSDRIEDLEEEIKELNTMIRENAETWYRMKGENQKLKAKNKRLMEEYEELRKSTRAPRMKTIFDLLDIMDSRHVALAAEVAELKEGK